MNRAKRISQRWVILSVLTFLLFHSAGSVSAQDKLPFSDPPMGGKVGPTMQQSVHKWRQQPHHLSEDAPNILIIMLDDAGFGQASAFGGEINTPIPSAPPVASPKVSPSSSPRSIP